MAGAPSGATLDAWIDFNGDGSWGGPAEQIVASTNVVVGDNNLTFDVPSFAIAGTTYARFRLSTAGGLGTEGAAADGEVEDYQVTVANPAAASGVFSGQNTISTAANVAVSVFAADVDGDGDLDVLSASAFDNKIAWYENDGSQNFTAHTISTAADGADSVTAADMDGDGDLDVLSASRDDDKIAWYENRNAPVIVAFDTTVTYVEGALPLILDANATVTDLDTTRFNGGVLTISLIANAEADDRLEFRPVLRLIGVSGSNLTYRGTTVASFTGGTGAVDLVITFNVNATVSAVQTVLRNVTYRSVSANPSILTRTAQVTLTDGTGMTSNLPTKTINVTAVPIPPFGSALPAPPVAENPPSVITLSPSNANDSEYSLSFANTPTARADNTGNDQNREYLLSFVDAEGSGRLKKRRRSL